MTADFNLTDFEKVATIIDSKRESGKFGKRVYIGDDTNWTYRVELDSGRCVLVRRSEIGWQVECRGIIGEDWLLEEAARLALDAGGTVLVSRDYQI